MRQYGDKTYDKCHLIHGFITSEYRAVDQACAKVTPINHNKFMLLGD
ncbi:MAG: hypothetical protein ACJAW8_002771 [Oleispira sp.]|jgi:hypothetical protein